MDFTQVDCQGPTEEQETLPHEKTRRSSSRVMVHHMSDYFSSDDVKLSPVPDSTGWNS